MTEAEQALWHRLRRRQLAGFKFRRQLPMGPYIVDFVCLEAKLIIEIDGGQHAESVAYDDDRCRWFSGEGYKVMRFWNNEVLQEREAVVTKIESELRACKSPPSQPSPLEGKGARPPSQASPFKGEGG